MCYMHNPESVLENQTHELLWDFEIQMDHRILPRWPDQVIADKKENLPGSGLWVKLKESKKRDKY